MLQKIKIKFFKNLEISILGFLIFLTIISTSYYNYSKKKILSNYKDTINNIYLKKTVDHIFNTLEPRFKKIEHKVSAGETFGIVIDTSANCTPDVGDTQELRIIVDGGGETYAQLAYNDFQAGTLIV